MNDPHSCSIVLRKLLKQQKEHRQASYSMYQSLPTDMRLNIDDKVRIRFRKGLIRKESSVFTPLVSQEIYSITEIDKSRLPYLYKINNGQDRKYYAWNLLKIDDSMLTKITQLTKGIRPDQTGPDQTRPNDQQKRIIVQNIINETKQLRNGKKIVDPSGAMYKIQKDGSTAGEYVTKNTLLKYKELFGADILKYDEVLRTDPYYKDFIV